MFRTWPYFSVMTLVELKPNFVTLIMQCHYISLIDIERGKIKCCHASSVTKLDIRYFHAIILKLCSKTISLTIVDVIIFNMHIAKAGDMMMYM